MLPILEIFQVQEGGMLCILEIFQVLEGGMLSIWRFLNCKEAAFHEHIQISTCGFMGVEC